MKTLITAILMLALPAGAMAQRHYAILSLVGDEMMIVQREMQTGSRLETNARQSVSMPDATIDRGMLLAVDDAVRRADPSAKTTLLVSRRQAVYDAVARALDKGGSTAGAFEAVRPIVATAKGATHLILVTKYRHAAMLRMRDGHVGSGTLEGVGFYVDYGSNARSYDLAEAERGLISPYAYFRVSLVDLASGKVLAEDRVIGSRATSPAVGTIGNAWAALTPQEKDKQLQDIIREETARVVPMVIAAR